MVLAHHSIYHKECIKRYCLSKWASIWDSWFWPFVWLWPQVMVQRLHKGAVLKYQLSILSIETFGFSSSRKYTIHDQEINWELIINTKGNILIDFKSYSCRNSFVKFVMNIKAFLEAIFKFNLSKNLWSTFGRQKAKNEKHQTTFTFRYFS